MWMGKWEVLCLVYDPHFVVYPCKYSSSLVILFPHFVVAVLPISVLYLSLELWEQKVTYRWVVHCLLPFVLLLIDFLQI